MLHKASQQIGKLLLMSLVLSSVSLYSQEDAPKGALNDVLSFNGYIKDMQVYAIASPLASTTYNFIHNRLNLKYYPSSSFTAALEVRNRVYLGSDINKIPDFVNFVDVDNGYVDLSALIIKENALLAVAQIDRFWLDWGHENWQIRVGRQRINWGKTLIWNPNDLFNTFNYTDFDYEEQPGSDALKATYYPTGMSSIEAAIKPGKASDETVAAGIWRFNRNRYDLQVLAGVYRTDLAFGLGWAGNIKNAGFKGEATWFQPKNNSPEHRKEVSAAITVDYSFEAPIYLQGGILYNSHNSVDTSGIVQNGFIRGQELSPKNLMPSDWSFFGQISGNVTPLFRADLAIIQTISPAFTFIMPSLNYSVFDNLDITLLDQSVFLFTSTKPNNLHSIYLRLKWSF